MSRADLAAATVKRRIECLPLLRAVAATLVVLYHTDLQLLRLSGGAHAPSAAFGAAGTDLLFVISGFTMVYISHGKPVAAGEFLFRRLARIGPLYWLLTLGMLAAFFAVPSFFKNSAFDPGHVLASLAFVPYPHPVLGVQRPFLVPGWALNAIAFFYLVFALFLFLPAWRRIVAVALVLGTLVALRWLFFGASHLLDFYGAPVVLDFVFGMLVAWAYLEGRTIPFAAVAAVLTASAAIFTAGVLGGVGGSDARVLYWGLADSGFLFSALFIEREWGWWNPGVLAQVGEASFATYLSNIFTLALVAKAVQMTGLFAVLGTVGTQILLVASALAVGVSTSILIERPLHTFVLRNAGRWFHRPASGAPGPAGGRATLARLKCKTAARGGPRGRLL